jgi:hypothetical protein
LKYFEETKTLKTDKLFWDRKINMQMMQRSINDSRLNSHSGVVEDSS